MDAKCCCCLSRSPNKDLKTSYTTFGKTEVYADMLKECFVIHLSVAGDKDDGICEPCIDRLRDACDFKIQVQKCQKELQARLSFGKCKDAKLKVKEELSDAEDENGIYFLDLKEELSDLKEELSDLEISKDTDHISEIMRLDDVAAKKKVTKKKRARKRSIVLEQSKSDLKEELSDLENADDSDRSSEVLLIDEAPVKRKLSKKKSSRKRSLLIDQGKADRKSKKFLNGSIKLSLRTLSKLDNIQTQIISENNMHRTNIQNVIKHSNCTPFSNKTLAGIVCAFCKETLQDLPTLRQHTTDKHKDQDINFNKRMDKNNISIKMDITDLKCNICSANFDVITSLKNHLSNEHDIGFYPDINDYILEFKLTDSEILNCALCNSTFETFKMLLQHMNGHYRNYICDICDMGFINKHRLKNHQRTHALGNFKCTFCDKEFTTRVRQMCHEKYTHNTNARYTTNCPHCDQSFTSYYQRNRHMYKEHNTAAATYKCNICDKSFILKSKLTSHIKKVHLMERNHICSECGQGFFIKQSLDEHMIKHNGERVFKCTICNKAYARKKTLREHMRIHNNDRRFKCGVCGSAFVQKCSLKSHMLSNHGVTLSEYESNKINMGSP